MRYGNAQVEIVRRGALDQCVERGIAELLPPLGLELRGVFTRRVDTL